MWFQCIPFNTMYTTRDKYNIWQFTLMIYPCNVRVENDATKIIIITTIEIVYLPVLVAIDLVHKHL